MDQEISKTEFVRIKEKKNLKQINNSKKQNNNSDNQKKLDTKNEKSQISCFKKYKLLFICIGVFILLLIIMAIIIAFILIKKPTISDPTVDPQVDPPIDPPVPPVPPDTDPPIDPPGPEPPAIKKEFEILTKAGDLRKISVVQKSKEKTKLNNETFTSEITRKTNYDIYFKSEEDASEENKKYYSKMYTGVVSINSECTTVDTEDCEPKSFVDLTSTKSRNKFRKYPNSHMPFQYHR